MTFSRLMLGLAAFACLPLAAICADDQTLHFDGKADLPGNGKHIVMISGDEEYRSEEALPMLAQMLSQRHGFECTVLFSLNPEDGTIDPNNQTNVVGMEALDNADLCIIFTRFRELPDESMQHFVEYLKTGKPIIGMRTSTHAFAYSRNQDSPFANYSWNSSKWKGGFGQQVLGETWINHHGSHGNQSTRGVINEKFADHPILNGIDDLWGPTDVYGVVNLEEDSKVLLNGQVLKGMSPDDEPLEGKKNSPMMPLAWVKPYQVEGGKLGSAFCTTYGAATDLQCEDGRRLITNAVYFLSGLEDKIDAESNVDPIGEYKPTNFGFGGFVKGKKPADYKL